MLKACRRFHSTSSADSILSHMNSFHIVNPISFFIHLTTPPIYYINLRQLSVLPSKDELNLPGLFIGRPVSTFILGMPDSNIGRYTGSYD